MNARWRALRVGMLLACCAGADALAYDEGAPWGAADPGAEEHCASCHWEVDPRYESTALTLERLPEHYEPGQRYVLIVHARGIDAAVAGFQLIATADGQLAGEFAAEDGKNPLTAVATEGNIIRSRRTVPISANAALWTVIWKAPTEGTCPVTFLLAVTGANDDQSPFGDTAHYRQFSVPAMLAQD
ncbi:MAG: choice-of-anchor V domain-containing protein [Pseudomonadota bacterium]